jgi:hypothetical protein
VKGPGFEVLTAVSTKMAVSWVVTPCNLVEVTDVSEVLAASVASCIIVRLGFLFLPEEHKLKVGLLEERLVTEIFGTMTDELTDEQIKLRNSYVSTRLLNFFRQTLLIIF